MGLEIAKFLIEVEEKLGIDITSSNLDQPKDWTVGDMVDLIEKKIREKETEEILSEDYPLVVAKEMEKTLKRFFHNLPSDVNQETLMSEIFSESKTWDRFLESNDPMVLEMESAVSVLAKHRRVAKISLVLFCIFVMIFVTGLLLLFDHPDRMIVALLLTLITGYIWLKISRRILSGLNARMLKRITFADLVKHVTEDRRRHLKKEGQNYHYYTREEIERFVIKIISDVTAIKINKITLDKTLVRDLWMG